MCLENIERSMKELVDGMNEGLETIKECRVNMTENYKKNHEEFNLNLKECVIKIDDNLKKSEEINEEIDSLFGDIDDLFDSLK